MEGSGVNRGIGPELDGQPAELFLSARYPLIPTMQAFPSRVHDHLERADFFEGKSGTELLFMGDLLVINLMHQVAGGFEILGLPRVGMIDEWIVGNELKCGQVGPRCPFGCKSEGRLVTVGLYAEHIGWLEQLGNRLRRIPRNGIGA